MSGQQGIRKAAGVLVRNRKLLVGRSRGRDFFIAPGGKPESSETMEQALVRELREEFGIIVRESDFELLGEFSALAAGKADIQVEMTVFFVKQWIGEPAAGSEVEEALWIDSISAQGIKLGSIFAHEVLPRLQAMDIID